jgi:gentisate 1,2-dioxygenase
MALRLEGRELPGRLKSQGREGLEARIDERAFQLAEADTCCAPGYATVTLRNRSAGAPAFLFIADEAPLHRKLGIYESRS